MEVLKKIVVKGEIMRRKWYKKSCKFVLPEFNLCSTASLYVTFTDSGWSFEIVPVNVTTVKGNLRNSGGIPA